MSTPITDAGTPLQTAVRKPMTDEERERRRALNKTYRRYKCGDCGTHYEDEHYAQTCCPADTVYVCPTCDEQHHTIEEAQGCERGHAGAEAFPLTFGHCPSCNTDYGDAESAVECCLWRTMPFADRLTLIDHVRFGRLDAAHAMIGRH